MKHYFKITANSKRTVKRKECWTAQDTKRFKALAVKHALNEIDDVEEDELAWLQAERRRLASHLDAAQILAEFRRAEMLAERRAICPRMADAHAPHPILSAS